MTTCGGRDRRLGYAGRRGPLPRLATGKPRAGDSPQTFQCPCVNFCALFEGRARAGSSITWGWRRRRSPRCFLRGRRFDASAPVAWTRRIGHRCTAMEPGAEIQRPSFVGLMVISTRADYT